MALENRSCLVINRKFNQKALITGISLILREELLQTQRNGLKYIELLTAI